MTVDPSTATDALERELGYSDTLSPSYTLLGIPGQGLPEAAYAARDYTEVPELQYPRSSIVFDAMHRTDSQVVALEKAIAFPLLAARWHLVGDDVDPRVAAFVSSELGLDLMTGRARRRRQGIVWAEHLRHALLMSRYGSAFFEKVFVAGPPNPGTDLGPDLPIVHHLRKLGWRSPRTLREVLVGRDGGLLGIVQEPPPSTLSDPARQYAGVIIPVERLVAYVNEREGADWGGQSVLRSAYRNYMAGDHFIRIGAQSIERNNMGVPVVTYETATQRAEAQRVVRNFRAGARAGVVMSKGMTLSLVGVTGGTKDELPLLKWHNEQVAKSALQMFLSLGQSETGSRALGDSFEDLFLRSIMAVGHNIAETTTEHVIRDLVSRNFGEDEPYPVLTLDDLTADMLATPATLVELGGAGLLGDVSDLAPEIRRRLKLPAAGSADSVEEPLTDDVPEDEGSDLADYPRGDDWDEPARSTLEIRLGKIEELETNFAVLSPDPGASRLRDYWVRGAGRKLWVHSAHPWRTLRRHLSKYIKGQDKLDRVTSAWYRLALGHSPNQKR